MITVLYGTSIIYDVKKHDANARREELPEGEVKEREDDAKCNGVRVIKNSAYVAKRGYDNDKYETISFEELKQRIEDGVTLRYPQKRKGGKDYIKIINQNGVYQPYAPKLHGKETSQLVREDAYDVALRKYNRRQKVTHKLIQDREECLVLPTLLKIVPFFSGMTATPLPQPVDPSVDVTPDNTEVVNQFLKKATFRS